MTADHQIAALERQCATAMLRGDEAACASILGDDYTVLEVIEDQPLQITLKDDWLKRIKTNAPTTIEVDDVAVSIHGDVAIAIVKLTETTKAGENQLAFTDIWRKEQEWRLVERHESRALSKSA
jgi:ketosteroid isomerase-like protein